MSATVINEKLHYTQVWEFDWQQQEKKVYCKFLWWRLTANKFTLYGKIEMIYQMTKVLKQTYLRCPFLSDNFITIS